jgi:hypothetical protein
LYGKRIERTDQAIDPGNVGGPESISSIFSIFSIFSCDRAAWSLRNFDKEHEIGQQRKPN